jgi:hypothetical protein
MPALTPDMIVAEVSKNWPEMSADTTLLSQRFETVIQHNRERGYKLHSWRFSQNGGLRERAML